MRSRTYTLLAITALLFAGCSRGLQERVKQLEREKAAAEAKVARLAADSKAKDVYLASVTSLLNEVQDRLDKVQIEKTDLDLKVETTGEGKRFVKSKSLPQALDRLTEKLQKNKEQIGQLEALATTKGQENQALKALVDRLKKQNDNFERQVLSLKKSVVALSKDVKRLKSEVENLEARVTEKEEEVRQNEAVITERDGQLKESESERWAGFYVIGTRKELEDQGIVNRRGLMKKRLELAESLAEAKGEFKRIDVRNDLEIPLGSLREIVEILPARPQASYRIENRDGKRVLTIQDPEKFWQLRHLIVVVKN